MPGVVDEHVEAGRGRDGLGRRGDAGVVGDVELHEARAELVGGGPAARRVAGADPDVMALGEQAPGGLVAEALVRPGDQSRGHASRVARGRATTTQTGTRRATLTPCAIIGGWTRRPRRLPAHLARPARPGRRRASPAWSRRRAPGLRREEVAQLAGLSVDYLARLEQGRASAPVAVGARAARPRAAADATTSATTSSASPARRAPGAGRIDRHITPSVQRVLDRLADVPVLVVDAAWQPIAKNALASGAARRRTYEATSCWRHFARRDRRASCATPRRSSGWRSRRSPISTPPPVATPTTSRCTS